MPTPDLIDLMRLYALRGISDWQNASDELRKRARACLGSSIAENEAEAVITINTIFSAARISQLKFIPMPKHPLGGVERFFFLPIRENLTAGSEKISFDLFLLVARKDCLAFRFEQAHGPLTAHGYGHVQMSRSLLKQTIATTIPSWIPNSYPAFPISTSDPLEMFLCMATTAHGYAGGFTKVLQEIFQKSSRTSEVSQYLSVLKTLLR